MATQSTCHPFLFSNQVFVRSASDLHDGRLYDRKTKRCPKIVSPSSKEAAGLMRVVAV